MRTLSDCNLNASYCTVMILYAHLAVKPASMKTTGSLTQRYVKRHRVCKNYNDIRTLDLS